MKREFLFAEGAGYDACFIGTVRAAGSNDCVHWEFCNCSRTALSGLWLLAYVYHACVCVCVRVFVYVSMYICVLYLSQ